MFDKDGDGQISAEEVAETMKSLGIKIDFKDVKKMVKRVDTDGRPYLFSFFDNHTTFLYAVSFKQL